MEARARPTPGVAQGAIQGGSYAAKVIRRRILGRPYEPFRYSDHGDVAVIGRLSGVTNIRWLGPFGRQGGFAAWALWLGHPHLLPDRLLEPDRRARSAGRGPSSPTVAATRLITGQVLLPPIEEPEPPVLAPIDPDEDAPG